MKRIKKTVEKRTYSLQNAFPRFVSIVTRGANFTPLSELRFSEDSTFGDVDINQIVFSKAQFASKEAVADYLQSNEYADFEIAEDELTYFVPGIETDKFHDVSPIEYEAGVQYFVGKLKQPEASTIVGEVTGSEVLTHSDLAAAPDQPPMQGKKLKNKVPDDSSPSKVQEGMKSPVGDALANGSALDTDELENGPGTDDSGNLNDPGGDDDGDGLDTEGNGADDAGDTMGNAPDNAEESNDRSPTLGISEKNKVVMASPKHGPGVDGINTLKPGNDAGVQPGGQSPSSNTANQLKPGQDEKLATGGSAPTGNNELKPGTAKPLPKGGSAPNDVGQLKPGTANPIPGGGTAPNGVGEDDDEEDDENIASDITSHSDPVLSEILTQFADIQAKLETLMNPQVAEPVFYSEEQVAKMLSDQKEALEAEYAVKIEEFSQSTKIVVDETPIVIQNKQGLQETKELIDSTIVVVDEQKLKFEQKKMKNLVGLN